MHLADIPDRCKASDETCGRSHEVAHSRCPAPDDVTKDEGSD
jgi:hypothetical protein